MYAVTVEKVSYHKNTVSSFYFQWHWYTYGQLNPT